MFDHIILEPVQEEILVLLVEASRNVPLDNRQGFYVDQSSYGDFVQHQGFNNNEKKIYMGDIEALSNVGLLNLNYGSGSTPKFDIAPLGFKYYEHIMKKTGKPTDRIEQKVRNYFESNEFQKKYSDSFDKWSTAENLLWETDNKQQLTMIGHLCREAVQEFADVLIKEFQLHEKFTDKAKTIDRIRAILELRSTNLGKTEKSFLEALLSYWCRVNDLIQRQEHGGQRQSSDLIWEDGRRVVFQTMIIMYEIDKSI